MAISFPSSPSIGQQFTQGSISWTWNGSSWDSYVASNVVLGSASFVKYTRTATQGSASTNTVIVCNVLENSYGSDISVNTSTGQVTLAAGRTYRLRGGVPGYSGGARPAVCWWNETAGAWMGEAGETYSPSDAASLIASGGSAECVYTANASTVVSFRVQAASSTLTLGGNTDFNTTGSYPWIDIEVISGTTAFTSPYTVNSLTNGTWTVSLSSTGTLVTPNVQNFYINGSYPNGNFILNPAGTGDVYLTPTTQLYSQDTTQSTSTTTGAVVINGGVGVGGNLIAGGYGSFTGPYVEASVTSTVGLYLGVAGSVAPYTPRVGFANSGTVWQIDNYNGQFRWYVPGTTKMTLDQTGVLTIPAATSATSTTTGALVVSGGAGIAGNLYVGGNVVTPARPAFRVYGAGTTNNLSTTQNGNGVLNGNNFAVDYNQGGYLSTSTGAFTAPVAGIYQVNLTARTSANNNATIEQLCVVKNTITNIIIMIEFGVNTTMNHTGGSTAIKLAVGDTLQVRVTSGTINFDTNDNWSVAFLG